MTARTRRLKAIPEVHVPKAQPRAEAGISSSLAPLGLLAVRLSHLRLSQSTRGLTLLIWLGGDIIGVAGSVAVGKSTTARVLQALLARWPNTPKVDLVTTDGFLLPNAVLESEGA